jgi:phosphate transport system substrate-binding protein
MVLSGKAQLAGVTRSLRLAEKQRPFYYRIIGYDAVHIFVHPDNPVSSLTKQQLKAIYTGRLTNWYEVGGPDASVVCITQIWGEKRAQMIEFQEDVMDRVPYRNDRKEVDRQSDQVAALLVEPYRITAVSSASARSGIKAVAIEGFLPEPDHVRSGAYLLSRPLLLVSQAPPTSEVKQFIDFMVTPQGQEIVARTFVPIQ